MLKFISLIAILSLIFLSIECGKHKGAEDEGDDCDYGGNSVISNFCDPLVNAGMACMHKCNDGYHECVQTCMDENPNFSKETCESYCVDIGKGYEDCSMQCEDDYPAPFCVDSVDGECLDCPAGNINCCEYIYSEPGNDCLDHCCEQYDPGNELDACVDDCRDQYNQGVEYCKKNSQ